MSYSKSFREGIEKEGLTMKDLERCTFIGSSKDGPSYYTGYRGIDHEQSRCVCGHIITEKCYIQTNIGKIIIVGNVCMRRFGISKRRKCLVCGNGCRSKTNLCFRHKHNTI